MEEGSISCKEVTTRTLGNRFACLNEMSLSLELKNEAALREQMEEYLKKDAAVSVAVYVTVRPVHRQVNGIL